jgi:NADPH:quinone reductase-like Zn-dependent oxidoreductase
MDFTKMKAIVRTKYGPPEVLQLQEIEKPTPKENEVLIKVLAASINPFEWHHMRGNPFLLRFSAGLLKPKHKILGKDMAGIVEAVGKKVKQFIPGDEVFGSSNFGALAEFACVVEDHLAVKPANATFEEAATLPMAALTALQGLRDDGQVQPRQKVLINGSSGGVGTFAVQIAKSFGAEVTGVCSTRNLDMVRSIGADHVIDYTKEDFTQNGQHYDLIIDNVGNRSVSDLKRALSAKGICVVVGYSSLANLFQVMFRLPSGNKKIGFLIPKINKKDLTYLKGLLETGKIVPVIDRLYPLSETAEAIRYLEEGHARGKVVITV